MIDVKVDGSRAEIRGIEGSGDQLFAETCIMIRTVYDSLATACGQMVARAFKQALRGIVQRRAFWSIPGEPVDDEKEEET